MRDKSFRRKAAEKALKKGRCIAKKWGLNPTEVEKTARKLRDTPKRCSCWICRNPRRGVKGKEKLTIQERRKLTKEDVDNPPDLRETQDDADNQQAKNQE